MRSESFYTPLETARCTLLSRHSLRKQIEEWWREKGFPFPEAFRDTRPIGFISRHIATARYEDLLFIRLCEKGGLKPIWSTYTKDRFIDRSPVKYSYLQPRIITGFGKRKSPIVRRVRLAEPKLWEGRPLDQIPVEGGTLISWHRLLLEEAYTEAVVTDPSDIYQALGGARGYYPFLLSLALAHGVLFEDFHSGESGGQLDSFTSRVFEPAFQEVNARFNATPLIVRLPWWKELGYYLSLEFHRVRHWWIHPLFWMY